MNANLCGAARTFERGGVKLTAWEWGDRRRPSLLLLHSLAAHSHWWDGAVALLEGAFHIVAVDFRGHGGSAHAIPPDYRFDDYVADIVAVLDVLGRPAPLVIGHSMGAYVGATLAARHPARVRALVIADMLTGWTDAMAERARSLAGRPPLELASRDEAVARFRLTPPETRAPAEVLRHLAEAGVVETRAGTFTFAFDRHVFLHPPLDPWPFLGRVECPTLVVRGEGSVVMSRDAAERVAAAVKRGTWAELRNAWHHLILDDPAAFVGAVERWLTHIEKEDAG